MATPHQLAFSREWPQPMLGITDHRIGLTSHNLTGVMAGDFTEFTAALQKAEMAERMEEA
jgi:peptide chain release factor 1